MRRSIVRLSNTRDDYGVYVAGYRNGIGTPLYFRGTLNECLAVRM